MGKIQRNEVLRQRDVCPHCNKPMHVLSDPKDSKNASLERFVFNVIEETTGVPIVQLRNKTRQRHVTFPRHLAMFIFFRQLNYSCNVVGGMFNRDHTSVLHGCKAIQNRVDTEEDTRELVKAIVEKIDFHKRMLNNPMLKAV